MADPRLQPVDGGKDGAPPSKFREFVTHYHSFIQTVVIGLGGILATVAYQAKQSQIAEEQALAQIKNTEITTNNQWRIERAEVLSKNLQVLSGNGDNTVERYGVLLSLTRGEILDPELAVSYALQLGERNTEYMRSVLLNINDREHKYTKPYDELLHNYFPSCLQRFGVARQAPICRSDKWTDRSQVIAEVIADEMAGDNRDDILKLIHDPREGGADAAARRVRTQAPRLAGLFDPYLEGLLEHNQLDELKRFEQLSWGARLIADMALADSSGEVVSDDEADARNRVRAEHRVALAAALADDKECDGSCKAHVVDVMLTSAPAAAGAYDQALSRLLEGARPGAAAAIQQLHSRLLWCQLDGATTAPWLRDNVLVPVAQSAAAQLIKAPAHKGDDRRAPEARLADAVRLLALTPEPRPGTPARAPWDSLMATLARIDNGKHERALIDARRWAEAQRKSPPAKGRALDLCYAQDSENAPVTEEN